MRVSIGVILALFVAALLLRFVVASRASQVDGWGGLARMFGTSSKLDALAGSVLVGQVVALMRHRGPKGRGDEAFAARLLPTIEGLYIDNRALVALRTPCVLVPWAEVQLFEQRALLSSEVFVFRLGRALAYLHVTREAFEAICRFAPKQVASGGG